MISTVGVGVVATPAAAEDDNGDGDEAPWQDEDDEEDEDESVVHQFSDDARITDYEWEERTLHLTVEADSRTTFTLTDAGVWTEMDEGDDQEIPFDQVTLSSGEEKTIEFTVGDHGTRAVSVMADGGMWGTLDSRFGAFSGAPAWSTVWVGVGTALAVTGGIVLLVGVLTYKAMNTDHRQVF